MAQTSATDESLLQNYDSDIPSSVDDASCLTSITSTVLNYPWVELPYYSLSTSRSIFDRADHADTRYHAYHEGEYLLPNDDQEQDRLDLTHHIYLLLLKGALNSAPVKSPARVLDLGTGTGIWAIDFSDKHPESEVIGIDLSPIQPSWTPLNCRFQIDDYEQPWSFNAPFDYIHGRELEGAIGDHGRLFRQAFDNLRPNGWFEMSAIEMSTMSDDGTHLRATCFLKFLRNIRTASEIFGKCMDSVPSWRSRMIGVGFVNVQEELYELPQGPWSKDPQFQELGRYNEYNMIEALPAYAYALFTRVLGWQRLEIEALLAGARRELKDPSVHLYTRVHVIYGQKPRLLEQFPSLV